MNRFLFLIFLIGFSLSTFAQKESIVTENVAQVDSAASIKDSIAEISKEHVVIDAMSTTVEMLKSRIGILQAEVRRLQEDSISKSDTIARLMDSLNRRTDKLHDESEKAEAAIRGQERIEYILSHVDEIVYKQCLLYPLEAKYDSTTWSESLQAIDAFININNSPSEKFNKYKEIYYDLLKQYPVYYNEILHLLKEERKVLNMTCWEVGAHKEMFLNDMRSLPYWKFYIHRNEAPFKSILYLDNVIDKFKTIVNKSGNVKNDIDNLINSVSPSSK